MLRWGYQMEFILIFPKHLGGLYWISWQLTLSVRRSKLFLLTFSFTLRDLGNCDDQTGGVRRGRPATREDGRFLCRQVQSTSNFQAYLEWWHIGDRGDVGRIAMQTYPISILSWITFIKCGQVSVPERGQTGSATLLTTVRSLFQFFPLPAQWPSLPLSHCLRTVTLPVKLTITERAINWHFSFAFLHIFVAGDSKICTMYIHYTVTWRPCLYGWWWFIPSLSSLH